MDHENYAVDEQGVNEEVLRCLEMVAISRVFDIEGLWEVLKEVGQDSETDSTDDEGVREESTGNENGVEMIIIDNLTHLINELFARKERSEGMSSYSFTGLALQSPWPKTNQTSTYPSSSPFPSFAHTDIYMQHPHNPAQYHRIQYQQVPSRRPLPRVPLSEPELAQASKPNPPTDLNISIQSSQTCSRTDLLPIPGFTPADEQPT